jgi:hypothetical protein
MSVRYSAVSMRYYATIPRPFWAGRLSHRTIRGGGSGCGPQWGRGRWIVAQG